MSLCTRKRRLRPGPPDSGSRGRKRRPSLLQGQRGLKGWGVWGTGCSVTLMPGTGPGGQLPSWGKDCLEVFMVCFFKWGSCYPGCVLKSPRDFLKNTIALEILSLCLFLSLCRPFYKGSLGDSDTHPRLRHHWDFELRWRSEDPDTNSIQALDQTSSQLGDEVWDFPIMTSEWALLTICKACCGTKGPGEEAQHY